MLKINGREVYINTDAQLGHCWDDALADVCMESAEWADTGEEFTEAEYAQYEELLEAAVYDAAWEQCV